MSVIGAGAVHSAVLSLGLIRLQFQVNIQMIRLVSWFKGQVERFISMFSLTSTGTAFIPSRGTQDIHDDHFSELMVKEVKG